jgi:hypothetical protein
MISGPLLALLAPLPELRVLALPSRTDRASPLFLIFGGCVVYCAVLTLAQGDWSQAASGLLKWGAPLVYGLGLYLRAPNTTKLLRDAASAFTFILPIIGLYGIYQYVDPPMWDRYWMAQAAITSAGQPLPYEVRVFSTMHAPAAFATFTAAGILLIFTLRSSWVAQFAILPAVLALALSLYRTSWISLAASALFCVFFAKTRAKAGAALLMLAAVVIAALLLTPFDDVIADRLATLGDTSNDGSAQERLFEFQVLWDRPGGGLLGVGFPAIDTGTAGAIPIDGMFAISWACMGIVVGLVGLASLIALIIGAMARAPKSGEREGILLGALAFGWLVQLPLAGIAYGEIGFLFWMTIAMAMCIPRGSA